MRRNELQTKADTFRKLAEKADEGMRIVYLKQARAYYSEAGLNGMARWCERHMG